MPAKPRPSLSGRICLTDGKLFLVFQYINSFWLSILTKVEHLSGVPWPSSEARNGDRVNPNTSTRGLQKVVRSQSQSDNVHAFVDRCSLSTERQRWIAKRNTSLMHSWLGCVASGRSGALIAQQIWIVKYHTYMNGACFIRCTQSHVEDRLSVQCS